MLFRLLLWILAWRINSLSKNNQEFKSIIDRYQHVVLQFRTEDNRVKRYYAFDSGTTRSRAQVHQAPTMSFVFQSPKQAMTLIKKMGEQPQDKTIFIYGIRDGLIRIEGDMAYMTWFQAIAKFFGPAEK